MEPSEEDTWCKNATCGVRNIKKKWRIEPFWKAKHTRKKSGSNALTMSATRVDVCPTYGLAHMDIAQGLSCGFFDFSFAKKGEERLLKIGKKWEKMLNVCFVH